MLCGLWVDIERIGTASEVRRKHPDWVVKVHGSREGRTVLYFTNPEAVKYAEETLAGLIERYKLDVFRLDFNTVYERGIIQDARDGFVETTSWRHYEALYAMYARLRKRFPNLMIENCAAGGGRNDLGMMENAHWAQMSDESTPTLNLRILNGFTLALPPEMALGFVGMMDNANYRYGDLDFRFRIQLFGHLCIGGIAPSVSEFSAAYRERIRHHVELYKSFMRPILPTVKVYHHTPVLPRTELGDWAVLEYATPDHRRGYAGIFRLGNAKSDDYLFRPRGLDVAKIYKVTFDNAQNSVVLSGLELQERGLSLRISQPLHSELLLFEAQ
jgi:alpha-galactosidase